MLIDRTIVGDDTLLTQLCSNLAMSAKKKKQVCNNVKKENVKCASGL